MSFILVGGSGRSWSNIGRSAELTDTSRPTMVLSLKGLTAYQQKYIVIHEFGHALGLYHEHQREDFWNIASTVLDVDKMKNDPLMKDVDFERDIFPRQLGATSTLSRTGYDPQSVMHYW